MLICWVDVVANYDNNFYHLVVATVSFKQSAYSVNENNGVVQPELILNNPSSVSITVQVTEKNNTAMGKKTIIIIVITYVPYW